VSSEWDGHLKALGSYLRAQRRLADLSLRQMAELAGVSNPYLSQIERGLHEPSVRILRSIAQALNLSAESVLEHAGLVGKQDGSPRTGTEAAIRADTGLSEDQKQALLAVYRSYRASTVGDQAADPEEPSG
jgi:transcriptional regulator with XRE-family HTH domain